MPSARPSSTQELTATFGRRRAEATIARLEQVGRRGACLCAGTRACPARPRRSPASLRELERPWRPTGPSWSTRLIRALEVEADDSRPVRRPAPSASRRDARAARRDAPSERRRTRRRGSGRAGTRTCRRSPPRADRRTNPACSRLESVSADDRGLVRRREGDELQSRESRDRSPLHVRAPSARVVGRPSRRLAISASTVGGSEPSASGPRSRTSENSCSAKSGLPSASRHDPLEHGRLEMRAAAARDERPACRRRRAVRAARRPGPSACSAHCGLPVDELRTGEGEDEQRHACASAGRAARRGRAAPARPSGRRPGSGPLACRARAPRGSAGRPTTPRRSAMGSSSSPARTRSTRATRSGFVDVLRAARRAIVSTRRLSHDLDERQVRRAFAVGDAAPDEDLRVVDPVDELAHESASYRSPRSPTTSASRAPIACRAHASYAARSLSQLAVGRPTSAS